MKMKKRITVLVLSLAALLFLPVQALAAGSIDTEREMRLTISYQDEDTVLSGAVFDIYRVAAVDETGELTAVEPFDRFNVDIRGKNDAAWKALASTLEGYVLREEIAPTDSGKTDAQGLLNFPNQAESLEQGLYLILGHRHTQDGRIYDAAPSMVLLPTQDVDANEWTYDVTVNPKCDSQPVPGDKTIIRKVLKVWSDDGHKKDRPKKVVVQLLQNGKVYDTISLNADNNWRYTWKDLSSSDTWTVVEKEIEDYTVTVTREGTTFVVTNTYKEDQPGKPTTPVNNGKSNHSKLPQTGQLWWPIPVLLSGGLLFIILGLLRRRRDEHEE